MSLGLKRTDLQAVADEKLADAMLLLKHRRFSNAYYLAGYAVEVGLKACIARQISAETIPDLAFIRDTFSHKLRDLVGIAGLGKALQDRQNADVAFASNWALATEWRPEVRYRSIDPSAARSMVSAAGNSQSGVLPWIRLHW